MVADCSYFSSAGAIPNPEVCTAQFALSWGRTTQGAPRLGTHVLYVEQGAQEPQLQMCLLGHRKDLVLILCLGEA